VTGIFWYRFHRWGAVVTPGGLKKLLLPPITAIFSIVLIRIRGAIASNLDAVLGPCGFWRRQLRIYRTLREFAWCVSERYERLSTGREFTFTIEGDDHWRAAASGGFIVATAHIGHWETASALPADATGRKVHVVREDEMDPRAREFIRGLLADRGGPAYETHFAGENPGLGLLLLEALRHGEIVALQGDRPRQGGRVIEVELFGRKLPFPEGPAALARSAGAPLVPVFAFREGWRRYRVAIQPLITVPRTSDRQSDLTAATQEFARCVERAIRRQPHQWFCFRRLWP
jgi:lauroyl/myristoyl acyltransferase